MITFYSKIFTIINLKIRHKSIRKFALAKASERRTPSLKSTGVEPITTYRETYWPVNRKNVLHSDAIEMDFSQRFPGS